MANFRYYIYSGKRLLAKATTRREAEAEALRVGGRVVDTARRNPVDPEYSVYLGEGSFSTAYESPSETGDAAVELVTQERVVDADTIDATREVLFLARRFLQGNTAAQAYLPRITPVRLDAAKVPYNDCYVREAIYKMPKYITAKEYLERNGDWADDAQRVIQERIREALRPGYFDMAAAVEYFAAKTNGDWMADEAAAALAAVTAIADAGVALGVTLEPDVHMRNLAVDANNHLILNDPVVAMMPWGQMEDLWAARAKGQFPQRVSTVKVRRNPEYSNRGGHAQ